MDIPSATHMTVQAVTGRLERHWSNVLRAPHTRSQIYASMALAELTCTGTTRSSSASPRAGAPASAATHSTENKNPGRSSSARRRGKRQRRGARRAAERRGWYGCWARRGSVGMQGRPTVLALKELLRIRERPRA